MKYLIGVLFCITLSVFVYLNTVSDISKNVNPPAQAERSSNAQKNAQSELEPTDRTAENKSLITPSNFSLQDLKNSLNSESNENEFDERQRWHHLFKENPEQAIDLLNEKPALVMVLRMSDLRALFALFGMKLLNEPFLSSRNVEQFNKATAAMIFDNIISLDEELALTYISSLSRGSEIRKEGYYELVSFYERKKSGVELIEFVYQANDDDLTQHVTENISNYSFSDFAALLDWIVLYDYKDFLRPNVGQMISEQIQHMSIDEIMQLYFQTEFKQALIDAAILKYSQKPDIFEEQLSLLHSL
ncbi:hypothetical protein [Alteromonas sp. P256]|uniref:hypothetical protein n=1 Tax=Alteromonas sp. P256 TaxID=3117399 RepID=UPI002FE2DE15